MNCAKDHCKFMLSLFTYTLNGHNWPWLVTLHVQNLGIVKRSGKRHRNLTFRGVCCEWLLRFEICYLLQWTSFTKTVSLIDLEVLWNSAKKFDQQKFHRAMEVGNWNTVEAEYSSHFQAKALCLSRNLNSKALLRLRWGTMTLISFAVIRAKTYLSDFHIFRFCIW